MNELQLLETAKRIQAIAQAGLTYAENGYDLERYQELRDISLTIMANLTGEEIGKIQNIFAKEVGYQTPKTDIRAAVFQDGKILLVKEIADGCWSMPGGWADVGYTPAEVAVKEVREEAGLEVEVVKLTAILDKTRHNHPPYPFHTYKLFFLCKIVGGSPLIGMETSEVGFFDMDNLPELSLERNIKEQILLMYEYYKNPDKETAFD